MTDLAYKLFDSRNFMKHDFSSPHLGADHDPIAVSIASWAMPAPVGPRCTMWNKRDLRKFQTEIEQMAEPPPDSFSSMEHASSWYASLSKDICGIMQNISDSKPKTPPERFKEWDALISAIASQARKRTKTFYRRLKSAFAIPRGQPAYPVPARKIRRILHEAPIFSESKAFRHTQQQTQHPDPPPPRQKTNLESSPKARETRPPVRMGFPPTPGIICPHRCSRVSISLFL